MHINIKSQKKRRNKRKGKEHLLGFWSWPTEAVVITNGEINSHYNKKICEIPLSVTTRLRDCVFVLSNENQLRKASVSRNKCDRFSLYK